MDDWILPLADYWDQRTGAINTNAIRLSRLTESERVEACSQIREEVRRAVYSLSDNLVLQASLSMVDGLYKYVNDEILGNEALYVYLDAFGRTFTTAVREKGYVIQYVVENEFSGVEFLMLGPFDLFSRVFLGAGFAYICPQLLAFKLMQADGVAVANYSGSVAQYIAEARMLGDRMVRKCRDDARHYVFLETDFQDGSLDTALQGRGAPGVLSVFRNEAPAPGSEVAVAFPEQKLGRQA